MESGERRYFFKRDIKKEIKKVGCRTTFKKDNRIEPIDRSKRE